MVVTPCLLALQDGDDDQTNVTTLTRLFSLPNSVMPAFVRTFLFELSSSNFFSRCTVGDKESEQTWDEVLEQRPGFEVETSGFFSLRFPWMLNCKIRDSVQRDLLNYFFNSLSNKS